MKSAVRGGWLAIAVASVAVFAGGQAWAAPPLPGVRPASEDEAFRSAVAAASAIVIADVRVRLPDARGIATMTKRVKAVLQSQSIEALARAADLVVYGTGFRDRRVVCAPFGTWVTCPLLHVERSLKGGREGEVLRIFSVVPRWCPTERHALVFLRRAPRGCFEVLQSPAGAIEFDPTGHDGLGVPAVERLRAARAALVGARRDP